MSSVLENLKLKSKARLRRVIFPETQDPRVIEAIVQLADQALVHPVLLMREDTHTGIDLSKFETVSLGDDQLKQRCAEQLAENRKHKRLSVGAARRAVEDPLRFASLLVKIGFVDAAVAGSVATSSAVILAGSYGIGLASKSKLVSSFFLMQFPGRAVSYADCGVVPVPDAEQLAEIAIAAARSHRLLTGKEPLVAFLSFSTLGSASHPRVLKIREALAFARQRAPGVCFDGELQFDAAFEPTVAARKAPNSEVAGKANVFIFPDLDSGNIAYKITQRLGGAKALGPLIQGLEKPFMDLSRGCSVEDIVDVAVVASVLS